MVTISYVLLVLLVAAQRLVELHVSRTHEAALRARGAVEHGAEQMPYMKAVHTGWLIACLAEVWLFERAPHGALVAAGLILFALGQALRLAAIHTLGQRWTVKILTLPDEPPVDRGVFRFLRHPNYLGVILEIAALPLVHSAYLTAIVFSAANAALLFFRIRREEEALAASSDYDARLGERPRLVPAPSQALGALRRLFSH